MSSKKVKLRLKQPYLSIKELPETTLPSFSVITGINGSGKSHLLQAIEKGLIEIEGVAHNKNEIRLFDWSNFLPVIGESSNPHSAYQSRGAAIGTIYSRRQSYVHSISTFFSSKGITGPSEINDPAWLAIATEEQVRHLLQKCSKNGILIGNNPNSTLISAFINTRKNQLSGYRQELQQYGTLLQSIEAKASQQNGSILDIGEDDIRDFLPIQWSSGGMLQLQIADWFSKWHAAWEYNRMNRFYAESGEATRKWLSDNDFQKKFGPEPWELINKVLSEAGVRYRFNRPDNTLENLHENFQLKLEDPIDGTSISAQSLSPGEKVFLAVTLLLYQSEEAAVLAKLPRVLLLDEVDAPLHPSLTKALIRILHSELVERCGMAIVMTTHSPSTVALAPVNSVYELVRSPRQLRPIRPSAASQILSSGFVSISSADVVVLVESGMDFEYYDHLYHALLRENKLVNHPPLKFVPASQSVTDKSNGGCTQVRKWAVKLDELGLGRFRGLVDGDVDAEPSKVVSVLKRHSMENYLFDPLNLIAYMISRNIKLPFHTVGKIPFNIDELAKLDVETFQVILDSFFDWIATETTNEKLKTSERTKCSYLGWPSPFAIPSEWLSAKGHALEVQVRIPLNKLGQEQARGALIKAGHYDELIKFQTMSFPKIVSNDFINIFAQLLSV